MKSYRYLLFDADETLLDFQQDMEKAFYHTYTAFFEKQRPYSSQMLSCYETCNKSWWDKFERGECTKPQLVVGRFADFLKKAGLLGDPAQINTLYFENMGKEGALFPGALELVRDLSASYELYIVTNGNAATQKPRLERSGLLRYVKDYFVSEDAGAAKPEPAYFTYVFSKIPGFQKEKALLIGDSLTSDMRGAQNAGIDSMWYHPKSDSPPQELTITYQVKSYDAIRKLLL